MASHHACLWSSFFFGSCVSPIVQGLIFVIQIFVQGMLFGFVFYASFGQVSILMHLP